MVLSLLNKKDHLVGLDIGSSSIKVAEIKPTGDGYALTKFGMARIAPGTIVEGRVEDMDSLAAEIKTLFKTHKIREKNVAISTGGHSVVIKTITINNRPDKELHEAILSEAEHYIPYDIEDVNIDYQVMGESEVSPDQVNVLLVAVKKDLVVEYMELAEKAGLNPRIIDVDTFALQNAYEILPYQSQDKVTLLVDVGASKISMNILKGDVSLMIRDAFSGTNQIVEEISEEYELNNDDAQGVISGESSHLVSQEDYEQITHKVVQTWCSEICELVHTYQSGAHEGNIENIILSGGGIFVEGFQEALLSELEADISVINPFEGLIVNQKRFPDSFITKASPVAPIAIGLALRRIDDK